MADHGTPARALAHRRAGEKPCEPCRIAENEAQRMYRQHRRGNDIGREGEAIRQKAMRLLAKNHQKELLWIQDQIRKGNL